MRSCFSISGQFHAEALLEVLAEGILQRRGTVGNGRAQDCEVFSFERVAFEAFDLVEVIGRGVAGFLRHHTVVDALPRLETSEHAEHHKDKDGQHYNDGRQGDPEFFVGLFAVSIMDPPFLFLPSVYPLLAMYDYRIFVAGVKRLRTSGQSKAPAG